SKKLIVTGIAAAMVLLLGVTGVYLVSSTRTAEALPTTQASRIKVGLIVSLTTATGKNFGGGVQGWTHAAIAPQLRDNATELYAVVDPGTEKDVEVVKIVKRYFPEGHMVNGGDPAALRQMDVIVASGNSNMDPDVLDAMFDVISKGSGFLCVIR